jgi:hypothetical protein
MNIHPVFHISLLEPALPGALPAPVTEIEPVKPNAEYEVEEILDHKQVRNQVSGQVDGLPTFGKHLGNQGNTQESREVHGVSKPIS